MFYNIYLNFKNRIKEFTLPSGDNRRYTVDISDESGVNDCILTFEIMDGVWRIISDEYVSTASHKDEDIKDGKKITVNICRSSVSFVIIVTAVTENMYRFSKYFLDKNTTIGSSSDCSIIISGEYISKKHAVISIKENRYTITDCSTNGLYINGIKADKKTELSPFDTIYFFGTKIIFLGDVIAINNSQNISVSLDHQIPYQKNCSLSETVTENAEEILFHETLQPRQVVFDQYITNAPSVISNVHPPDILKTSVVSSAVLTAAVCLNNTIYLPGTLICFAGVSAVICILLFASENIYRYRCSQRYDETIKTEKNIYLEEKLKEITSMQNIYRKMLEIKYPSAQTMIKADEKILFRLRRDDEDFLKIRLGKGKADFSDFISDRSNDEDIHDFCRKYSMIDDTVIILNLCSEKFICITGEKNKTHSIFNHIAFMISACHDCRDVSIMSFCKSTDYTDFSWMRWIPHIFSDDRKQRYFACSEKSYKNTLYALTTELEKRMDQRNEGFKGNFYPHFVVFCSSKSIFDNESVEKYIHSSENIGVTFIIIYKSSETLPAGCDIILAGDRIIRPYDTEKNDLKVSFDTVPLNQADEFARKLINISDHTNNSVPVPDHQTLFDMLQIRNIKDIDLVKRYKVNRAYEDIRAAIGVGKNQNIFEIDLHEKKHGPHGLVAGTTGSGKSEALQTLIISLALNYSPQEIAFVLVDYKGGGMSDAFEKLPHTAGIITNLTDSLENGCNQARRVLISLKSELRRRQKLFKEYRINHIDTYMRLYRDEKITHPLPHIIIIIDEFAELKKEQPDFINQLISISRIGRSLGVHLILATQKPSGVVDDEIWSNSRFRLCLRVQDKSESQGILRRPDASELTVTGRAYIQIGNNEIFQMIQTGYSGAPYDCEKNELSDACMIDNDAAKSIINVGTNSMESEKTQLSTAVNYIIESCNRQSIKSSEKLWIEPLPEVISADDICRNMKTDWQAGLFCIVGQADDPENQSVSTVMLNMHTDSNIIVAGCTGSGKTTLIKSMLYSLVSNYSPDTLKIYIFDFCSGLFDVFKKLPHCKGVYTEISDTILKNFFSDIRYELQRRKHLFEKNGVPDYNEYRSFADDLPTLVITFDGYSIFKEMFPQREESFTLLSGECVKYGIYFITSLKGMTDMKFRTRYNFRTFIPLTLRDRTEYTEIFGKSPSFEIPQYPGRGYIKKREILEFQAALFCTGSAVKANKKLSKRFDEIISRYPCTSDLSDKKNCVPEGTYCFYLKNIDNLRYKRFINKFFSQAEQSYIWVSDINDPEINCTEKFSGSDGAYQLLLRLKHIFSLRRDKKKQRGTCIFDKVAVVIYDMSEFCRYIYSDKSNGEMSNITEIFFENGHDYGVQFISRITDDDIIEEKACKLFMSYNTGVDYA